MPLNLEKAKQTFIVEARELLQDMESALLTLEIQPNESEAIGSIFRAAHTIKGSAGLFGLDAIVGFTHIVEDVLDRVRGGVLNVDASLVAVLLKSADHILELVNVAANHGMALSAATVEREAALRNALQGYRITALVVEPIDAPYVEIMPGTSGNGLGLWHISLRFGVNVLRNGMDPLSFLRYLRTLGDITSISTLPDALPAIDKMDPESCYLGFEIALCSDASRAAIAEAFDFVRDDCQIQILSPHSRVEEYLQLIAERPENSARLGEILIQCGALTAQELEAGLIAQASANNPQPLGEILVGQRSVEPQVLQAALAKQATIQDSKIRESRSVRVNADKLDQLINLVGELVIASAGANLLARASQEVRLQESTSVVTGLVEEILDGALRLRMIPIGETFTRFRRVVHDVSRELGKDIDLVISGGETELDKSVVEKIGDPLTHLLRNAMDHGIESPQARVAAGKPAKGTLCLNAFHDSGNIVIEIKDDGAGLNRDRILTKAQERGLVSASASLTDSEIYHLIFEPGFSTAEVVTSLSGRGVGMDVVKRNITMLRGTVELDSKPAQGTTIRIRLPLTLAIINGFLVSVGSASYIIPLDTVQECIELHVQDTRLSTERSYLDLRGEVLPLISLRKHFRHDERVCVGRENVVVVRNGNLKAGLIVDDLLGEFQTVIKPLGKLFGTLRGISGSTILGSGAVALIVDAPSLLSQAIQLEVAKIPEDFNALQSTR